MSEPSSFERDTTYRILVEAARHWVISFWLAAKKLPEKPAVFWVYSDGINWGNPPGLPHDPKIQPLRGKRIQVTLEIVEG